MPYHERGAITQSLARSRDKQTNKNGGVVAAEWVIKAEHVKLGYLSPSAVAVAAAAAAVSCFSSHWAHNERQVNSESSSACNWPNIQL